MERTVAPTPWGPWTALGLAVLVTLVATIVSTLLLKAGVINRPEALRGDSIGLEVLMSWQAIVIVLTLLLALRGGRPMTTLALIAPRGGAKDYAVALGLVFTFQVAVTSLEYLFIPNDMLRDLQPFMELARGPLWWLGLIAVGIGAPLAEELLFRGFLLPALAASRIGFAGAAIVSSVLWTALHAGYTLVGMVEVFAVGLLFSWLLWRTGSLRVTILCHAAYNSLIILGLRYAPLPMSLGG